MAEDFEAINTWVSATLGADSVLVTAIPRNDDPAKARAFYSGATDQQTSRPFIRWNIAASTEAEVAGDADGHSGNVLDVTVEGEVNSTLEDLEPIQARVKALLHKATGTALGRSIFESKREMVIPLVFNDEGSQYPQITNRFRVRVQ